MLCRESCAKRLSVAESLNIESAKVTLSERLVHFKTELPFAWSGLEC